MVTRKIEESKLLAVEGKDDGKFFAKAFELYGIQQVQIMEFAGIDKLRGLIMDLPMMDGFESLETLVVVRDADLDPKVAFESVINSLKAAKLPQPSQPFSFVPGPPRVGVMILPGYDPGGDPPTLRTGALEDLCLEIAKVNPVLECADDFLKCVRDRYQSPKHENKSRLHAYLSMVEDYAGDKLGEASAKGAWDYQHPAMSPVKEIIKSM
ncbi:MAG: hypothetical protein HQK60_06000 [Deltaproteobacteria bacterium]|nr:hypothetical protein [Deltaproteobacteria bacterium]